MPSCNFMSIGIYVIKKKQTVQMHLALQLSQDVIGGKFLL